jgi:hypothetical protein
VAGRDPAREPGPDESRGLLRGPRPPGLTFGDYVYNIGALSYLFLVCPVLGAQPVTGDRYRWALTRRMGLERLTLPAFNRPPVWLHAVSVGEVATAATIIDALPAPGPWCSAWAPGTAWSRPGGVFRSGPR